MSSLYLPGRGMVNLAARRVDRVVNEYDERLFFARHPENGQWTIFVKIERDLPEEFGTVVEGTRAYPVLGFPHEAQPDQIAADPEYIRYRLRQMDTLHRGETVLKEIHRHNDKLMEPSRRAAAEGEGQMAEVLESYLHDQGLTKHRRVLRPLKQTGVRGH